VQWCGALEGFFFQDEVGVGVDLGGFGALVA